MLVTENRKIARERERDERGVRTIVADCVSKDIVEGFRFRDVGAEFADYGDELAFVVEPGTFLSQVVHGNGVGGSG